MVLICILIQVAAFFATKDKPALTLWVFGGLGVVSTVIALNTTGLIAVYALLWRAGMLNHVALYILSSNSWTWQIHKSRCRILNYDDSWWSYYPTYSESFLILKE